MLARSLHTLSLLGLVCRIEADRYPDCVSGPLSSNDVCRMDLKPAERAKALVSAMTIDEKLANMVECVQKLI